MTYIIYSNLSLLILSLTSVILIRRFTFHRINRMIILSIPILSLLIPLIKFGSLTQGLTLYLPAITPDVTGISSLPVTSFSITEALQVIYFLGFGISLFLLIFKLLKITQFIRNQHFVKQGSVKIALAKAHNRSFSFNHWIFINESDAKNKETIIQHEKFHYSLGHTYDHLLFELFKCLFWFNPVIYWIHAEIKDNHEYEIDAFMNEKTDRQQYIEIMIQGDSLLSELSLTNSFSVKSNLLKRINMMTRESTRKWKKSAYMLLIPAIGLSMFVIACSEQSHDTIAIESDQEESQVISGEAVADLTIKPSFKGGMQYFGVFLAEEIKYPKESKSNNVEGTVYVSFVINEKGEIKKVEVKKSVDPLLDSEAVRAISEMSNWIPGEKNGVKVAVEFVVPITFELPKDESENPPVPPPPPL